MIIFFLSFFLLKKLTFAWSRLKDTRSLRFHVENHDVLSKAHFMPDFFYQSDFATYFDFQLFSSRINKPKNKRIILKFACLS